MSITTLSPQERRALLTRLLREKDHQPKTAPLSFAQERLWFLDQLEPGNPTYNMPAVVRLNGRLDVAALVQSLNEIVRRHETLRTTFAATNGRPVQVIGPCLTLPLPLIDLRSLPATERPAQAQRLITDQVRRPFDLAQGPLLRALLLRLAAEEYILVLNLYHIVSDGWSQEVLLRELTALYAAFSQHRPARLSELPLQYADYARWQREWLQGEVLERQWDYWQTRLADAPPALELPTDRPRPPAQTFRGARQSLTLSPSLSQALKTLSQRQGVTLFVTLLAAFKALLYRYTGQSDLIVGSPVAGRNRAELEGLIGFFANTLALRTDLSGDLTFEELLARVREGVLGAQAHQNLPFETLVERLQLQRDLSHTPLFQVMFVLQESPARLLELPGLTLSPLEVDNGTAKFDLTLVVRDTAAGLKTIFEYNTDLFDASTIARMLGHFQNLLENVAATDQSFKRRISELPLLAETERQQLLVTWNATQTDAAQAGCFHELFQDPVEQTPDAVALVWQDEHVTYRALSRRANQLAHHLRGLGVGPETLVGLCVERSPDMVVGILGTLKAGGAYVPLDPAYPAQRLAFMLKDAQVALLLTQEKLIERLPPHSAERVRLDADWARISLASDENPTSDVTPGNLAYAIYTSGSTGVPKGVLISNEAIANHCRDVREHFQLAAGDRVLQFASLSFDQALEQVWATLVSGATLVLRGPEVWPTTEFTGVVADYGLTVVNLPPAYWHQWVQDWTTALQPIPERQLRLLISGGEVMALETLRLWRQTPAGGARLLNAYGPTETTITALTFEVPAQFDAKIPIGRPLANRKIYVLDEHGNPVPVGVPGELYLGGVGLARGYLNRPGLTAERFVPDPFSPSQAEGTEGGRLYKTGDLVRYRPDGNVEFLGRVDHQVKVRGFRIELGEIEAVLRGYPAVHETAVLARDDGSSGCRLVAYVVPNDKASLSHSASFVSELRSYLRGKLPDYMLPAIFVPLAALPRSPSGKIDRRALPAPEGGRPELEASFVAPRTRIEATLAELWAEVLGLERVGVHDNFFELGGDSILCIQLIARANQAGLQFTPKQLFENQTIAQLAAVADSTSFAPAEQDLVTGPVPLTPIQHWFFERDLPAPHHFNQTLLLQAQRPLDAALLEQAFERLLVHHDALRLRFERQPSGWQQFNASLKDGAPFTCIDLTALSGVPSLALETAAASLQASLNLERGPLARMAFFELGAGAAGRLLIVIHHLAVDGISWRILLQDLWTVYQQLERGDEAQLPPKTTSFQQWAERLVAYAQTNELQHELDYWTDESRAQVFALPLDHDTGDNDVASSATVSVALSAQETHALLHEVPPVYHTHVNDVLLTALAQAFAQWTGVPSLLVDLESHGRETPFEDLDLSRTVGWFTSVAPLLLDLSAAGQPGEALMAVKERLRRVPAAGVGYGLLRYLGQDEDVVARLRALPQAEVSFNYLGQIELGFSTALPFHLAPEWAGPPHDPQAHRRYLLEVNGSVTAGQLQFGWRYSQNRHRRSTVEQLAQTFIASLQALIAHCQSPQAGGHTVSDFPAAEGLDQQELDDLLAEFGEFAGD